MILSSKKKKVLLLGRRRLTTTKSVSRGETKATSSNGTSAPLSDSTEEMRDATIKLES